MTDERDTQPPAPPDEEFSEVEIGSLPPSVTRDIARRLVAYEDRQVAQGTTVQEIHKMLSTFAGTEVERHASLDETLRRSEVRQETMLKTMTSIRREQIKLANKLEAVEASVDELGRNDSKLRHRLDELSTRLDELTTRLDVQEARDASGRQQVQHDAATAREVVAQDAGAAREQIATEAGEARDALEREASDAREKLRGGGDDGDG
jgi:chromosome segregation ATPase